MPLVGGKLEWQLSLIGTIMALFIIFICLCYTFYMTIDIFLCRDINVSDFWVWVQALLGGVLYSIQSM